MLRSTLFGGALLLFSPLTDTRIRFYHNESSELAHSLRQNCPTLSKERFFPTWWLAHGWAQAAFGGTYGRVKGDSPYGVAVKYTHEEIPLPDGATMSIEWQENDLPKDTPILIILHGLTGSSGSQYIRNAVEAAGKRGYRVGVLQFRGVKGHPMTSPYGFHLAPVDDLEVSLAHLRKQYPKTPFYCLACSMGANLGLKYAGLKGKDCEFEAICAVATPFDVGIACNNLASSSNPVTIACDKFLLKVSKKKLNQQDHDVLKQQGVDIEAGLNAKRTKEFLEQIVIHNIGYKTVREYYDDVSCVHHLHNITIPVFCLQALDDPVVTRDVIPYDDIVRNPNMLLAVTRTGGHVGWYTGNRTPQRWYPQPVLEVIDFLHNQKGNK